MMQKIEPSSDYPCPCRKDARLIPIALTEALGCDKCSDVYVVINEGMSIEQVSGMPGVKRILAWNGKSWQPLHRKYSLKRSIIFISVIILWSLLIWIIAQIFPGQWAILACILAIVCFPMVIDLLSR